MLPNNARWTLITGAADAHYQVPNNPGQPPVYCTTATCSFDSSKLNEQQLEQNYFGVLAFQQSTAFADYQVSYFTRYSSLHYTPDLIGDLMFNGIATDLSRTSFLNGIQADSAFRIAPDHTLSRASWSAASRLMLRMTRRSWFPPHRRRKQRRQTVRRQKIPQLVLIATLLQLFTDLTRRTASRVPRSRWWTKKTSSAGIAGVYIQDEWRITDKLTLNTGLRFDQMWQYVDANQLSPRIAAVYKPLDGTVFHAG